VWSLVALALAVTPVGPPARAATAAAGTVGALPTISCGGGVWLRRPGRPRGFDPLTATAAQLRAVDFPPRPSDPASLADWQSYAESYRAGRVDQGSASSCGKQTVSHHTQAPLTAKRGAATPDVIPPQHPLGTPTRNWAGFVNNQAAYADAEAEWRVPIATATSTFGLSSAWVGVGLGSSSTYPLVQAGSASDTGCFTACPPYGWYEIFGIPGLEGRRPIPQLSSIGGHLLMVHVTFRTDGSMAWHIVDVSSNVDLRYAGAVSGTRPDGHAEFIVERVTVRSNGMDTLAPLANFGLVVFQSAQSAAPNTGWRGVGNFPNYFLYIVNSAGQTMAHPGAIDSTGYSFHVRWDRAT
jgi:hypothetical protein